MNTRNEVSTPPPASLTDLILRVATHPVSLICACVVSFILWMPYGFGYYDFPWKQPWAVYLLLAFVIAFPAAAASAVARAWRPRLRLLRLAVGILSLFMGLHGLLHMLHWWQYVSQRS